LLVDEDVSSARSAQQACFSTLAAFAWQQGGGAACESTFVQQHGMVMARTGFTATASAMTTAKVACRGLMPTSF
jgi:hypothetical protein